jgi:hypothetical protein
VPFARILVFALALCHGLGLADLVLGDACEEGCTDHGCGKDCLPGVACRCHFPSAMPLLSGDVKSAAKLDMAKVTPPREGLQRAHASPDPREILHVPRFAV